jgi:integrase/transposase-like protein
LNEPDGETALPQTRQNSYLAKRRTSGKLGQEQAQARQLQGQVQAKCPECGSDRLFHDGTRELRDGSRIGRFKCQDCGRRFTPEGPGRPLPKKLDWHLNIENTIVSGRQVCAAALARGAKNLDAALEQGSAAGIPPTQPADVKGKLVEFTWYMQKQGYAPSTIRVNSGALKALLARNADLMNPESAKEALAREQKWSQNRRRNVINAYTLFLQVNSLSWEKPRCTVVRKIPFIPSEQEIDGLVAGCPETVATFLQLLKETAMRSGEAKTLKWINVDFERRTITLNEPEKGSNPRIFTNLTGKLLGMLNALPRKSPDVFGDRTLNSLKDTYTRARRRLAAKLQNPRLLGVHFHTLRHWRATMEYHYTKDIIHVKDFLGHREIDNTMLYIQLDKSLFSNLPDDSFTIRAARTLEEATKLGEVGFEPFVVMEGVQLFRKRK